MFDVPLVCSRCSFSPFLLTRSSSNSRIQEENDSGFSSFIVLQGDLLTLIQDANVNFPPRTPAHRPKRNVPATEQVPRLQEKARFRLVVNWPDR